MLPLPILNVRLNACHADWQQMTPVEQGHHCAQCNRTVIDFTTRTQADLEAAFQTAPDGRVCGRFRQSQLAPPTPQLRPKLRRFLVALVLVCGLGLTNGEAWAQVRQATRTANCASSSELVLKTSQELNPVVLANHQDNYATRTNTVTPALVLSGEVATNTTEQWQGLVAGMVTNPKEPRVYTVCEQMPDYKFGGVKALQEFVNKNIRWPKAAAYAEGRVFISFIIDKTGRIRDAHVIKGIHPLLDAESLRVIKLLDRKFTPGRHNKHPVDVSYTLPITFKPN